MRLTHLARRRAAVVGEARRRNEELTCSEVDREIKAHTYDEAEQERLAGLRLATPRCQATCSGTGMQCKRSGAHHHLDRYYCLAHFNVQMGNASENRRGARTCAGHAAASVRTLFYRPDERCAVCLSRVDYKCFSVLKCGHFFHPKCLVNWRVRSSTCPTCKRSSSVLRAGNDSYKVVIEIPIKNHDVEPDVS